MLFCAKVRAFTAQRLKKVVLRSGGSLRIDTVIMNRIKIVDYLRGYSIFTIAIMHLIMGHLTGVSFKISMFGGAGVHVFILCSGFGLYLSYLGSPMNYGEFLKRRFGKVWIPYAIAVMLWGGGIYS